MGETALSTLFEDLLMDLLVLRCCQEPNFVDETWWGRLSWGEAS